MTQGRNTLLRVAIGSVFVLLLSLFFVATTYRHNDGDGADGYGTWGVFHYYLESKYFDEIGYFDLYTCSLQADAQSGNSWQGITHVRDLHTYRITPRAALPACPQERFTPERWSDFTNDISFFASHTPADYMGQVMTDKGSSATPFWIAVFNPVAEHLQLGGGTALILFNLDIILVLLTILLVLCHRGRQAAFLTFAFLVLYFGAIGYIGGNFFQYLWLPLVVLASILWDRNKPVMSGIALGFAGGLQAFPLFFALPILVTGAFTFLRTRKLRLPHIHFATALISTVLLCVLIGSQSAWGVHSWTMWQEKISTHKAYLEGEVFNIGLANLTSSIVSRSPNDISSYTEDTPETFNRLQNLEQYLWLFYALAGILLLAWIYVLAKARSANFGDAFIPMYALLTLSPYYYLTIALIPFFFWQTPKPLKWYAVLGTCLLFALHTPFFEDQYVNFKYTDHLMSELGICIFFMGLLYMSYRTYSMVPTAGIEPTSSR